MRFGHYNSYALLRFLSTGNEMGHTLWGKPEGMAACACHCPHAQLLSVADPQVTCSHVSTGSWEWPAARPVVTGTLHTNPHPPPPASQAGSLLLQQRTWRNPSSGKPSVTQTGSDWMPWVPAYTPSSQKNTAAQPSPTSSCCSCLPVFVLAGIKQLWLTSFTWTTYRLYLITIWHNNEHAYR